MEVDNDDGDGGILFAAAIAAAQVQRVAAQDAAAAEQTMVPMEQDDDGGGRRTATVEYRQEEEAVVAQPPKPAARSTRPPTESFFLSDPVSQGEVEAVAPRIVQATERVVALCGGDEGPALLERTQRNRAALHQMRSARQKQLHDQALKDAEVDLDGEDGNGNGGSVRDYQAALVEIAKQRNTIVHLGTGTGKTLIALLLIKHYRGASSLLPSASAPLHQNAEKKNQKKQTVFLVPSLALAYQQTMCIRSNLPYGVATA